MTDRGARPGPARVAGPRATHAAQGTGTRAGRAPGGEVMSEAALWREVEMVIYWAGSR